MKDEERQFLEEVAQTYADAGSMPRAAGRIYGYLLMGEQPHVTQAEIAAKLELSVASASSMLRLLCTSGLVRKVPVPGARMTHYGLATGSWLQSIRGLAALAHRYEELATRGLALLEKDGPARDHLRDMKSTYQLLASTVEEALAVLERDSAETAALSLEESAS